MNKSTTLIFITLTALLASCAQAPTATPEPSETATETATATEPPTETPTATPDYLATETAEATAKAEAAFVAISEELTDLGLPTEGDLVWVQEEPVEIILTSQNFDGKVEELGSDIVVGDFAMGIDVTWETTTGISGCGIIFRAEKDMERGKQIRFYTSRLSGLPIWVFSLYKYGTWQADLNINSNAAMRNGQGSTNHYLFIVQGLNTIVYANGTRIATVTLPADLVDGQFGFLTWEDSAKSTCTFENGWILEYAAE